MTTSAQRKHIREEHGLGLDLSPPTPGIIELLDDFDTARGKMKDMLLFLKKLDEPGMWKPVEDWLEETD